MGSELRAGPGWYVISLRPRGGHEGLRRAAARAGARTVALSPWALAERDDAPARAALARALAAPVVIATSPAAVRAAARLQPLASRPGQAWCAVGAGTAAALRRAGVPAVQRPARMDSEGLLALPALQRLEDVDVGLLTAPGGRGLLEPALRDRGARVRRADVYERRPLAPAAQAVRTLRALRAPTALALSSGEALAHVLSALPPDVARRLRGARVLAASARLAEAARAAGFSDVVQAAGPRPAQLVAALQASPVDAAPAGGPGASGPSPPR